MLAQPVAWTAQNHRPCTQLHQRLAAPIFRGHAVPLAPVASSVAASVPAHQTANCRPRRPVLGRTNQQMHLRGAAGEHSNVAFAIPTTIISRAPCNTSPAALSTRQPALRVLPASTRCRRVAVLSSPSARLQISASTRPSTASASASTATMAWMKKPGEGLCARPAGPNPATAKPRNSPRSCPEPQPHGSGRESWGRRAR